MYPGIGVGLGKDHTLVALVRGDVRLRAGHLGRKYVSVAAANGGGGAYAARAALTFKPDTAGSASAARSAALGLRLHRPKIRSGTG
jgi:hypothetical protein